MTEIVKMTIKTENIVSPAHFKHYFDRFLSSTPEEDPSRMPLLQLLGEMYLKQPRIGYHLLYFLKVG